MKFELPKLPYSFDALEPHISARTLELHYSKHHQGYLEKLEYAVSGTAVGTEDLESIVRDSAGDLYNDAAQVWNHAFYWNSMSADGGGEPNAALAERLRRDFGGLDLFRREFAVAASGEFGSGWAWLIETESGRLRILSSTDAENPMRSSQRPLLTLDVWEHAYYLDYQNERSQYIRNYLDHLINWRFAEQNLRSAP